jgi:amino acid transporter
LHIVDNGTGAPAGWNWLLSFLFTSGTLTGFDASGHVAEETKNASIVAARGILSSAIATGVLSFATIILYLFCAPPIDVWLTLEAPQPFVQIYASALGKGGAIVMTIVAIVGLVLVLIVRVVIRCNNLFNLYFSLQNTSVCIVAASRLIFAIARDGVLPGSHWIGQVNHDGQPRHAVIVMFGFGAVLLCSILPSVVAFTSLISAGGVPTIAAYGLIALLRLTQTPNAFQSSKFGLGRFKTPFYISAVLFNALIVAVTMLNTTSQCSG